MSTCLRCLKSDINNSSQQKGRSWIWKKLDSGENDSHKTFTGEETEKDFCGKLKCTVKRFRLRLRYRLYSHVHRRRTLRPDSEAGPASYPAQPQIGYISSKPSSNNFAIIFV